MLSTISEQLERLQTLRLPELQAQFAEIVGEQTRCPNKIYLLRRIRETLEATSTNITAAARLRDLSVAELRALYVEVVGRGTSSHNAAYMIWKIKQVRRGRIPAGPIVRGRSDGPAREQRVLPLRLPAATVEALDEVWRRHGLKSRMALFRQALDAYLTREGEDATAALIQGD